MTTARQVLDAAISEADFMAQIVDAATKTGWAVFHVYDSRRSAAGFPDLVLVRGATLIFLECKSAKGRVTPAQQRYIDQLKQVRYVYADIARPEDWTDIEATLRSARR
jgi:Holliday junction resolvase